MDHSITLIVTPEMQRERGATAFKKGKRIDSHNMNPGAPGLKDWTLGFMQAQYDDRLARHNDCRRATERLVRVLNGSAQP
jgi:hypothetical protein